MQNCQDNYSTTFSSYSAMYDYHDEQTKKSQWITCRVNELEAGLKMNKATNKHSTPQPAHCG